MQDEDGQFGKFDMPVQLLNQLNECTNGFILFSFDQDGQIEPYMKFDDEYMATSMFAFIKLYLEAQEEVGKDIIKMDHFYSMDEEMDDDDDDDIEF